MSTDSLHRASPPFITVHNFFLLSRGVLILFTVAYGFFGIARHGTVLVGASLAPQVMEEEGSQGGSSGVLH